MICTDNNCLQTGEAQKAGFSLFIVMSRKRQGTNHGTGKEGNETDNGCTYGYQTNPKDA